MVEQGVRHRVPLVLHIWAVVDALAVEEDTGHVAVGDTVLEEDIGPGEHRRRVVDTGCGTEVDKLAVAEDRDCVLVEEAAEDRDYGLAEGAAGSHAAEAAGYTDLEEGNPEVGHSLEEDPVEDLVEVGRILVAGDNLD